MVVGIYTEFVSIYYLTCDKEATGWWMLEVWTTIMTRRFKYFTCNIMHLCFIFLSHCGLMISYKCDMPLLYYKL